MKVETKDIGLDLKAETKEDSEILMRFYEGGIGIHILRIDSAELKTLRLSFKDMIDNGERRKK